MLSLVVEHYPLSSVAQPNSVCEPRAHTKMSHSFILLQLRVSAS